VRPVFGFRALNLVVQGLPAPGQDTSLPQALTAPPCVQGAQALAKRARRGWLRLQLAHRQRAFFAQRRGGAARGAPGAGRGGGWLARVPLWRRLFGGSPVRACLPRRGAECWARPATPSTEQFLNLLMQHFAPRQHQCRPVPSPCASVSIPRIQFFSKWCILQRSPGADDDIDDRASVASRLRDVLYPSPNLSPGAGGLARDGDDESVRSGALSDDALAYGGGRSVEAPRLPDR